MFDIILLYLLCTMFNFWRYIWSCFLLHELRQPTKLCENYSFVPNKFVNSEMKLPRPLTSPSPPPLRHRQPSVTCNSQLRWLFGYYQAGYKQRIAVNTKFKLVCARLHDVSTLEYNLVPNSDKELKITASKCTSNTTQEWRKCNSRQVGTLQIYG